MTETVYKSSGGCLCGAVRYETIGNSLRVINCHCESCRKHTGAPVATLPVYRAEQVKFSGDERKIYRSSKGVGRAFCAECGSTLTFEADLRGYGPICAIHISSFDDPDALAPAAHSFYSQRISWFDVADDLPRYEGFVLDGSLVRHGPANVTPTDQ